MQRCQPCGGWGGWCPRSLRWPSSLVRSVRRVPKVNPRRRMGSRRNGADANTSSAPRRPRLFRPLAAAPSRCPSTTRNRLAHKRSWPSSGCRPPATGSACWWSTPAGRAHRRSRPSRAWAPRWPTRRSAAASTSSASIRGASGTRHPNCVVAPTKSSMRSGVNRSPITAPPVSRTSSGCTSSSCSHAWTGWAPSSWPTSAP